MSRGSRVLAAAAALLFLASRTVSAATPASGTITELTPTASYTAGPFLVPNPTPTPLVGNGPTCDMAHPCDNYTLSISLPADYQATHPTHVVSISVSWPTLAGTQADFDMYVYDSTGVRATYSAGSNDPEIAFLPAVSGRFTVTVVPFDPQAQSIVGTITLGPAPVSGFGEGIYTSSDDVWSLNKHLTGEGLAFSHDRDAEPAVRIGKDGVPWVASNGGTFGTSGIGLWKITDDCAQASSFKEPEFPLLNGGGDVDVEVAPEKNALGFYNVYTSSLHATDTFGNFNSATSMDGGNTFTVTPISTPNVVDDRQWNAVYGASTIWLSYHSIAGGFNIYVVRSDANGLPGTFVGPYLVNADLQPGSTLNNNLGNLVVDQRSTPPGTLPLMAGPNGEANLYHGFVEGGNQVYVGVSKDFGVTWHSKLAWEGPAGADYSHLFSWVAVDRAGNVYTAFCDEHDMYYTSSTDQGEHWARPIRVNNGAATKTATMPAMAAGSAGRLVFAWYGAQGDGLDDASNQWQVFAARCQNALSPVPTIEQTVASDHVIHRGVVCEEGTNCTCCRELLDLLELDVNPTDGSSFLAYTDDGATGGTYIAKQLAGASAIDGKTMVDRSQSCPTNLPCTICPPPPPPNPCELPGVTVVRDPAGDQHGAPENASADIDSVMIAEPFFADGAKKLVATLKVDHLDPANLPPNSGWEVLWTSPNGTQYFVEMDTFDPTTGVQFHYGHVDPTLGESTDGAIEGHIDQYGFIRMTVDDDLVGSPTRGQALSGVHGQTEVLVGAQPGGVGGGELVFLDTTGDGVYTVAGNASCGLFALVCPGDRMVVAGSVSTLFFQISNSASSAQQFQYALSDSLGWNVGQSAPLSGQTPSIAAGGVFTLQVDAQVPPDCVHGRNTLRWSAAPLGNAAAAETCLTHLDCGEPETPCKPPGLTVATDDAGDQAGAPELAAFDVQHTWFAEPYFTDGSRVMLVTMKVADLTPPLPPNGVWRTFWNAPNDSTYYVAMRSDQQGAVTYEFGVFIDNGTTITQTRKGFTTGSETADGTIQVNSPVAYAGNPAAGSILTKITTETRVLVGTSVTGGLLEQTDIGGGTGRYTTVGNGSCALALICPTGRSVSCGNLPLNFSIINTGPTAAAFDYSLTEPLGWATPSVQRVGQTASLAPGAMFTLGLVAQVPNGEHGQQDVFQWSASIAGQPATAHSCQTAFLDTCPAAVGVDSNPGGTRTAILALYRPRPNPFTRATQIDYEIPVRGHVRLAVFSVSGERVRTLVDGVREAGRGTVALDGRELPIGLYYVKMEAAGRKLVEKVLLLR